MKKFFCAAGLFVALAVSAAEIKALQEEDRRYAESTKAYHEAKKYLAQAANYARFGELDDIYGAVHAGADGGAAE